MPDDVKQILVHHSWPGNVRELRVVVERALVLAGDGALARDHFVFDRAATKEVPSNLEAERDALDRRKSELERERVIEALNQAAGNQTRAAEILGISRRTLLKRLDEYALPRPRRRD
jgi:two-component system, NtrC family, response regulator AtoC